MEGIQCLFTLSLFFNNDNVVRIHLREHRGSTGYWFTGIRRMGAGTRVCWSSHLPARCEKTLGLMSPWLVLDRAGVVSLGLVFTLVQAEFRSL